MTWNQISKLLNNSSGLFYSNEEQKVSGQFLKSNSKFNLFHINNAGREQADSAENAADFYSVVFGNTEYPD
jgi:hypothetical protein